MTKQKWRLLGFAAIGISLLAVWACIQRPMKLPIPENVVTQQFLMPQSAERDVDILFLIDDSQSMLNEQANLQAQFVVLINALENMSGGLPNVHIGVATTDIGTANYTTIRFCEEVGGDAGILGKVKGVNLGETCIGPGQRYIVDVEPINCQIEKDQAGQCSSHSCAQANCDAVAGGNEVLTLATDAGGCPRCRNFSGSLVDTFSCLAAVGPNGCGFEQQLEAAYKALDDNATPENNGFVRDSAFLALITISDEDDCSASRPDVIFNPDPAENRIDSTLGYLHSFRCFEFGINCSVNGRDLGPRSECAPREDDQALLHPITRYTAFLEALKDPLMLVVATIGGPFDGSVVVQMDSQNRPELQPSCTDSTGQGATPGVRLRAFTGHFNTPDDMGAWAYTSVCNNDFSSALAGIGNKIADIMAEQCLLQPFAGCRDGPAGTACSPCLPQCTVFDIENRNNEIEQQKMKVPWCGSVCQNGLCTANDMTPCEYDAGGRCQCAGGLSPTVFDDEEYCAPLHYPNALPGNDSVDPALLTLVPRVDGCMGLDCLDGSEGQSSACWYLSDLSTCPYGAGFRIKRGEDPPARTFADGRCAITADTEQLCTDGEDNDEDCLIDCEDPDCVQQPACTN